MHYRPTPRRVMLASYGHSLWDTVRAVRCTNRLERIGDDAEG
jgi:hypothetical protein